MARSGHRIARFYDLALRMPDNETRIMAPHAFYMAREWEKFGFIHVTDIHVAKRIEIFHIKLARLAAQKPELREAAEQFNNFNDNFRDFIRYANHLHDLGLLDVILATGDLVDYGFDPGEAKNHQGGNYAFFEQLIRGQAHAASGVVSEELQVPIFTVFGNHDYRIHPYKLLFDLDVPGPNRELENYSPFNLTKEEAKALQGGHPTVSTEDGLEMVKVDNNDQQDLYRYYKKRINAESAYVLDLGPHRIVMLDTRFDLGIPGSAGVGLDISLIIKKLMGTFSENEKRAQDGGPNLVGFNSKDIDKVKTSLSEAGQSGLVIVGMHAPPLNIEGSELAHYFRETEHPTIDRDEVDAFLSRHGASGASSDWPRNGTPHFKTGTVDNLLDDGIAKGEINAFLQACAGVNVSRPVDLVLCGHNHDRVEYRLKPQGSGPGLFYSTDFYLGNPSTYYPSKKEGFEDKVHIRVRDNAPLNGQTTQVTDNRFNPPLVFNQLDVPPKANSLDKVLDRKTFKSGWWATHRPLIVETAALGPLDNRQRIVGTEKPSASFQGFRYFSVKQDEIFDSHYVVLDELRRRDFQMPWERWRGSPAGSRSGSLNPSRDQVKRQILDQSPLAKFKCSRYLAIGHAETWTMRSIGGNRSLSGASRRFLFPLVVGTTMRHLLGRQANPQSPSTLWPPVLARSRRHEGDFSSPWLSKRFFQGRPVQLCCSKRRNRIRSRSRGE